MSAVDESRLRDRINVASPTSASVYGDRTYSTPVEIPARVEPRAMRFVDALGEEIDVTTWIGTTRVVNADSLVWLPGANTANVSEGRLPINLKVAETVDGGQTWREFFL